MMNYISCNMKNKQIVIELDNKLYDKLDNQLFDKLNNKIIIYIMN